MTGIETSPRFTADTEVFLRPQGAEPKAHLDLPHYLSLAKVTVAPPMLNRMRDIMHGTEKMPGVRQILQSITKQQQLQLVTTQTGLKDLPPNKTGVLLSLQHTPEDITEQGLQNLFDNGIRILTPVYQQASHVLGSGYRNPSGRLTNKGKEFLASAAEIAMIIDLSHLGHQTAADILEVRAKRNLNLQVIASHGGVYELYDGNKSDLNNLRNLPWEVLHGVSEAGGIIGIYALTFGLSDRDNTLAPFAYQVAETVKRLGYEKVCLGTDSVYQQRDEAEWKAHYEWLAQLVIKSGELNPRFPDFPREINKLSKIDVIQTVLRNAGIPDYQVDAVSGYNVKRFLSSALPDN